MNRALPTYQPPTLVRHRSGAMNKMGAAPAVRSQDHVDGVPVEELVAAYGSPCFVYSQRSIEERYTELHDALARRWPRIQLAWSYKTCYLDAICRTYHRLGAWAECVSGVEVHKALRNGVPMHRVIFNGPHKEPDAVREALAGGAIVNLDGFDELAALERVADELGIAPAVGLRLNMAAGTAPRWDRFGFDLDSGQAWDAARRLVAGRRLRLTGLHCHLGTFLLDPESYRIAARKIAAFANRLRAELGIELDTIDLGGGFASKARLKATVLPGDPAVPSLDAFAQAVTDGLRALDLPEERLPLLILETGRALIDDAGSLLTTVVANKRLADGRRALIADAGVNVLFTSFWYQHDLIPTRPAPGAPEPTVVFGPLCMNIDVVAEHVMLPPMEVGSRLLVRPVGAYNVTQSMQFIHLRPAVALIATTGEHAAIRRAETLDDLVIGESVPGWIGS